MRESLNDCHLTYPHHHLATCTHTMSYSDAGSPRSLDVFFSEITDSSRSSVGATGATGKNSHDTDDSNHGDEMGGHQDDSGAAQPRIFKYTTSNGDEYTVQHRAASTIRTQGQFTWIMQHYREYRAQAAKGKGKTWLNENILPGFIALFGDRGLTRATLSRVS